VSNISKAKTTKTVIYLGPTIRGVAAKGTIYKNGIPDSLKEAKDKDRRLGELIIDIDGLPDAMNELRKKDSRLSMVYKSILEGGE